MLRDRLLKDAKSMQALRWGRLNLVALVLLDQSLSQDPQGLTSLLLVGAALASALALTNVESG